MARQRDYAAEYRRRQERAQERGFASYWQQRRAPRHLSGAKSLSLLPEKARQSRTDALRVVKLARSERTTIEDAASTLRVPLPTVCYWAGDALKPTRQGQTLPTRGDRLARLRPLIVEGESELSFVTVRGSKAADHADVVFDIQWRFLAGHASEAELEQIRGVRIGGRIVESDPDRLTLLARAGTVSVDEAYRDTVG